MLTSFTCPQPNVCNAKSHKVGSAKALKCPGNTTTPLDREIVSDEKPSVSNKPKSDAKPKSKKSNPVVIQNASQVDRLSQIRQAFPSTHSAHMATGMVKHLRSKGHPLDAMQAFFWTSRGEVIDSDDPEFLLEWDKVSYPGVIVSNATPGLLDQACAMSSHEQEVTVFSRPVGESDMVLVVRHGECVILDRAEALGSSRIGVASAPDTSAIISMLNKLT